MSDNFGRRHIKYVFLVLTIGSLLALFFNLSARPDFELIVIYLLNLLGFMMILLTEDIEKKIEWSIKK